MSLITPEELFIRRSVAYARTLPVPDCTLYLRGMLSMIGESDFVTNVRSVYLELSHCDSQLDLIATGQMNLFSENPTPPTPPATPDNGDEPTVGI